MTKEETPEYLAKRAAKGDEDCFVRLCGILKARLFRTAKGVLGDETLALDAVSEAVFRAFRGIKNLRHSEYAETWFTRILLNAAKDILRRRKHEITVEKVPEGAYSDNHSGLEFASLLKALPAELREIISLKYYSGHTLAETALILKIPEGTVKSRLARALKLLRIELLDENGDSR